MSRPSIIEYKNYLISSEIVREHFMCDLSLCNGACCVIGESGAPLEEWESREIERQFDKISPYLEERGVSAIAEQGFSLFDSDGDLVTPLVAPNSECAYTLFEDELALCAIERAYLKNNCSFRKPRSCWLYPIRVSTLSNGMIALNLHRWHLCNEAYRVGRERGVPLYKFLKEPIIEIFGDPFYKMLDRVAKTI